jgi:hypothetical protein
VAVSQGCRPITDPFTATRVEGNWILELDGKPALDVYREVAREPLAADLRHAAERLLVAIPRRARDRGETGDAWVARRIAGFAPGTALAQADAQKLERVEITGSLIKRVESELALPVTNITTDGASLANPSRNATTRQFDFMQVSINNISRIEVTKGPKGLHAAMVSRVN